MIEEPDVRTGVIAHYPWICMAHRCGGQGEPHTEIWHSSTCPYPSGILVVEVWESLNPKESMTKPEGEVKYIVCLPDFKRYELCETREEARREVIDAFKGVNGPMPDIRVFTVSEELQATISVRLSDDYRVFND